MADTVAVKSETGDGNRRENAAKSSEEFQPPDGGLHAWIIVIASFLTNGIVFGIHNCYGILYVWLKDGLEKSNVPDAATKASLVGSLSIGMTFFVSPLAGILIDSFGLRKTAILGGCIATIGMLASSFALAHVEALYLTYGVLFGAGTSLAYNPSLVILGHYFRRRLGFVNGLVTAGSSVFTITLPFFLDSVLTTIGLGATLQILSGIMGLLMVCATTFVPKLPPTLKIDSADTSRKTCSSLWKKYVNFSIWKNKKYVIWAIAVPISMFGYFVPYVHLVAYVKDILPDADGKILVLCIGVTSGVGRLIFGKIGDLPQVDRVILQQVAFLAIGIFTMFLTLANSFAWLVTLCLFMGLFDGCFVALVGPVAFDLCGPQSASQAIGFLLGLYSIPMTTGPPVAGALYESLGTYQVAFLLAGCPPIICAILMSFIRRVKNNEAGDASLNSSTSDKSSTKRKVSHLPDPHQDNPSAYLSVYEVANEEKQGNQSVGGSRVWVPGKEAENTNKKERKLHLPVDMGIFSRRYNTNEQRNESQSNNNVSLTNYATSAILW